MFHRAPNIEQVRGNMTLSCSSRRETFDGVRANVATDMRFQDVGPMRD